MPLSSPHLGLWMQHPSAPFDTHINALQGSPSAGAVTAEVQNKSLHPPSLAECSSDLSPCPVTSQSYFPPEFVAAP